MPRITKIKKGSIDLNSVFAPGFQVDADGKVVTGDEWLLHTPVLTSGFNTSFQMPNQVKEVDGILFLHFAVNGMQIPESKLSLNQSEPTIVEYDSTNHFNIEQSDLVEIWYVKG